MPLDTAAMVGAATYLTSQATVMKLHSGPAGDGTSNLTSAASQPVSWTAPSGLGNFSLAAKVKFTGGAPSGAVYSLSLWTSGGAFLGELPIVAPPSDPQFNGLGEYNVTAIDFVGTAT